METSFSDVNKRHVKRLLLLGSKRVEGELEKETQTLHLPNDQLLVQPVCPCEQQQLAASRFEELLRQADEPVLPEGLRGGEVGVPCPFRFPGRDGGARCAVVVIDKQGRDGDTG